MSCLPPRRSVAVAVMLAGNAVAVASGPWRTATSSVTVFGSRVMPYSRATGSLSIEVWITLARMLTSPMRVTASACASPLDADAEASTFGGAGLLHATKASSSKERKGRVCMVWIPSVIGCGQLAAAFARGMDRGGDQCAKATCFERFDRRLGGAVRRSDPATQLDRFHIAFGQHARGAEDGLQRQGTRRVGRQAFTARGRDHRLGQQEYIGWTAAGYRGDGIHQYFVVQPDRLAGRRKQALGELSPDGIDTCVREQAGDTGAEQRGCVRHRAHDADATAKPA